MKINDRIILGAAVGVGANVVKSIMGYISVKRGWAEIDGPGRAAGMLLPAHRVGETKGQIAGVIADNVIAGMLGVGMVYFLSATGKDKAILKGAFFGHAAWTTLYGVMGTFGATTVTPVGPKTVLSQFVSHTAYGCLAGLLATNLGDAKLFGETPLLAVPLDNRSKALDSGRRTGRCN